MKKRGEIKLLGWVVTLLLLEIILFAVLGFFINKNIDNVVILEDMYAKQIALLIDNSKPSTVIDLDMSDGAERALKNNMFPVVSAEKGEVKVILSSRESAGQSYYYFNNVKVDLNYDKGTRILRITIL